LSLEIGRTFIVGPDVVGVAFDEKETKTGKPIDFVYPSFLRLAFRFYLEKARPILRSSSNDLDGAILWVGRRGRAMDGKEIAQRIGVITKRRLGRRMWPHLFRHCLV
jgi:hypothetical protein